MIEISKVITPPNNKNNWGELYELLFERTKLRNTDFNNAKNMQQKIEEEIKNSNIPTITIEVKHQGEKVL